MQRTFFKRSLIGSIGLVLSIQLLSAQIELPMMVDSSEMLVPVVDSSVVETEQLHPDLGVDSLGTIVDSISQARIASLEARIDSLTRNIQVWQRKARRRLEMETYLDSFRNHAFYTCAVDPQKMDIRLFNEKTRRRGVHSFRSIAALAEKEDAELIFAMNAGMFEPDRHAKGLLIVGGKVQQELDTLRRGYGNFYMQPNGVFGIDTSGQAYVLTTQAYQALADSLALNWATQSGPMMVVNGQINPLFNDGSPNRHIRNAVGVTANNELIFAISAQRVTFYELSSFMINQGCEHVLYLDGAISQAYFPELGLDRLEAGDRLGPIIAITQKTGSP